MVFFVIGSIFVAYMVALTKSVQAIAFMFMGGGDNHLHDGSYF